MFFLLNSTFIFTILFGADIDIMAIIPDLFNIGIGEGTSFFERWILFGLLSVSPILLIMYLLFPFKYVTNINFTVIEIERAILFYTVFKYTALVLGLTMGYFLSKGISIF